MCLAVTKSRDCISNLKIGLGGNPKIKGITNICLKGEQVTMVHQRMAISNIITLLIHNIKVKRVTLLLHIWRSCVQRGMQWCSWLRHCATSQKIVGSIPDGVIGIFH
jgi:hypothetical protein